MHEDDDLFGDDADLLEDDHLNIDDLVDEEDDKFGDDDEDGLDDDFLPGTTDYDHGFGDED